MKRINKFNSPEAYENYLTEGAPELCIDVIKAPKSAIIVEETFIDGVLYRKYSDGIIEQAGYVTTSGTKYNFNFPRPFSLMIINAFVQDCASNPFASTSTDTEGVEYRQYVNTASLTSMQISTVSGRGMFWYVRGI